METEISPQHPSISSADLVEIEGEIVEFTDNGITAENINVFSKGDVKVQGPIQLSGELSIKAKRIFLNGPITADKITIQGDELNAGANSMLFAKNNLTLSFASRFSLREDLASRPEFRVSAPLRSRL